MIELRLLTTDDVEDLYPRLRLEDKEETICLGSNPREALLMGAFDNYFSKISNGRAYALVSNDIVIGAIGFTSSGYLWALSAKFTKSETMELFARTNEIVTMLLEEAEKKGALFMGAGQHPASDSFLHNIIHSRNKPAIKWLERSGLFVIDRDNPVEVGQEVFYPFRTKMAYETAPVMLAQQEVIPVCVPLN